MNIVCEPSSCRSAAFANASQRIANEPRRKRWAQSPSNSTQALRNRVRLAERCGIDAASRREESKSRSITMIAGRSTFTSSPSIALGALNLVLHVSNAVRAYLPHNHNWRALPTANGQMCFETALPLVCGHIAPFCDARNVVRGVLLFYYTRIAIDSICSRARLRSQCRCASAPENCETR